MASDPARLADLVTQLIRQLGPGATDAELLRRRTFALRMLNTAVAPAVESDELHLVDRLRALGAQPQKEDVPPTTLLTFTFAQWPAAAGMQMVRAWRSCTTAGLRRIRC